MAACTCFRHKGELIRCQWHGGGKKERILEAKLSIKEHTEQLRLLETTLKKLEGVS